MSAIIKCKDSQKQDIKEYIIRSLIGWMEDINGEEECLSVEEMPDGLTIEYPIGEVYGNASDYVQAIPDVFKELKEKYPNIEIWGIVYEFETVSYATFGPLFYCRADEEKLHVIYEWQECVQCGKIIETDACYNSSQWDREEGNLKCLCSPTCLLEYSLEEHFGSPLEPNNLFSESERTAYFEAEEDNEDDRYMEDYLWGILSSSYNQDEFKKDFFEKRDRIEKLSHKKISSDKLAIFHDIENMVRHRFPGWKV